MDEALRRYSDDGRQNDDLISISELACGGGLGSCRFHADEAAVAAPVRELHDAGDEREERVVFALADVFAGLVARTALAYENRACVDELAPEALYAQPLPVRIAAVCRGAAAFLMCHDEFPFFLKTFFSETKSNDFGFAEIYSLISLTSTDVKFWRWPREILY
jgi:hypothetical protein